MVIWVMKVGSIIWKNLKIQCHLRTRQFPITVWTGLSVIIFATGIFLGVGSTSARTSIVGDEKIVAALDTAYQAAVEKNDADKMDRILADDFVLVLGDGRTYHKADLLNSARSKQIIYEHQVDSEQTVRVWGNTAVVTALLWLKGTNNGQPFERKLWFSDTYVRTSKGWRYVFGQASLPLPKAE